MGPLDGQAAYLSCPNLTDDDITQLKFLVDSMDLAIQAVSSESTTTFSETFI